MISRHALIMMIIYCRQDNCRQTFDTRLKTENLIITYVDYISCTNAYYENI
jgi:hypothetical protein